MKNNLGFPAKEGHLSDVKGNHNSSELYTES